MVDGNMKNRRDVCAATDAGYIEYKELGVIKSGCQLSPIRGSNFCYFHAPRISTRTISEESPVEDVVQFIVAKSERRSGCYYKVYVCSKQ